jgi:tetratricopeptide (TPR) repeat protein
MKRTISLILGLLLLSPAALAGVGTTGANFLLLGGGARPLGMGEAYVALADDSSATFWNPAGLSRMIFPEIQYMYNQWFLDVRHSFFNAAFTTNYGTFGGSYSLLDSGDIPGFSGGGSPEASFKSQDTALTFSWGRKLNDRFSLGVSLKSIGESLANYQAQSLAFDLGCVFDLSPKLKLGAAIQNIGQPLKFISEQTALPLTERVGLAITNRLFDDSQALTVDYVNSAGSHPTINIGGEYLFREFLALRGGLARGSLRAGVGLRASQFGLDYAYLYHNSLGATHQVSLLYSFGSEDRKKALLADYVALAQAYYNQGKVTDGLVAAKKAVALDPENAEARAMLTKLNSALEGKAAGKAVETIQAAKEKEINVYLNNGKKFMSEKQYLEAIAEFNKALKVAPSHPETVKSMREAQSALEAEVTEKVKDEAKQHLGLALQYIATDDYNNAFLETKEVLKIDPGNVQALKLYKKLERIIKLERK